MSKCPMIYVSIESDDGQLVINGPLGLLERLCALARTEPEKGAADLHDARSPQPGSEPTLVRAAPGRAAQKGG